MTDLEPPHDRALRDKGFEEPSSERRPVGTSDADDSASIDPQEPDEAATDPSNVLNRDDEHRRQL